MNKREFSESLAIAKDSSVDLQKDDMDIFSGFGLPDFPVEVFVTIRQIARLIRWQCFCFDGSIDSYELNEIGRIGRRKFQVIG